MVGGRGGDEKISWMKMGLQSERLVTYIDPELEAILLSPKFVCGSMRLEDAIRPSRIIAYCQL